MRMGKLEKTLYLGLGICFMVSWSLVVKEQSFAKGQPRIAIDSLDYDAGEVWEGDEIVHTFSVRNEGDAELIIENVKPG